MDWWMKETNAPPSADDRQMTTKAARRAAACERHRECVRIVVFIQAPSILPDLLIHNSRYLDESASGGEGKFPTAGSNNKKIKM